LNAEQRSRLLRAFEENNYLTEGRKKSLATDLGLNAKTVHNWFQNKRQTTKKRGQAPGVSQSEPMDDAQPPAADPLPGTSIEDSVQIQQQTPLDPDAASYMPISPNILVTPVRVSDGAGPSSAPREEEIGGLMASQSAQNRNSVTNDAIDDSDPDDLHAVPRDQSR